MASKETLSKSHQVIHTEPSTFHHGFTEHEDYAGMFLPESRLVHAKKHVTVVQNPTSSISSSFLNAGTVDFRINSGSVDVLSHIWLEIAITNNTAAALKYAAAALLVDRCEIYGSNGNKLLSSITGDELFISTAFFSEVAYDKLKYPLNSDEGTDLEEGFSLAAGSSADYYIPLLQMLSTTNLCLPGIKGELLIKFRMRPESETLITGSAATVDNVRLILDGYKEPQEFKESRIALYNNPGHNVVLPYLQWSRQYHAVTLAANSEHSIVLSGIKGVVAAVIFNVVRDSDKNTPGTHFSNRAITKYDILDSAGNSLTGAFKKTGNYGYIQDAQHLDNKHLRVQSTYLIPFCENLSRDYHSGSNTGSEIFDGFQKLIFTNGSATGAATVRIWALTHQNLLVNGGDIDSTRT